MASLIKLRRDTAAIWTSVNPILASGEPGLETDTNKIKYGDGLHRWNVLSYASGGSSSGTTVVAFNGGTLTNALIINTTTDAISQTTGALQVRGGVGIAGTLWAGEIYVQYDSSGGAYPGGYDAGLLINNTGSNFTGITMVGKDSNRVFLAQSGGTLFISKSNAVVDPSSSLYTMMVMSTANTYISATTPSTNPTSGALTVNGGVGIAKDLYVSGNIYMANDQRVLTTATGIGFASYNSAGIMRVDQGGLLSIDSTGTLALEVPYGSYITAGVLQVGAGINVDAGGIISVTTGAFALQTATSVVLGGVKIGTGLSITGDGTLSTVGTSGLSGRNTTTTSTGVLLANSSTTVPLIGHKSYLLQKVTVSTATWLTIYASTTAMADDASRSQGTDPTPGSGVIAEIITAQAGSVLMTPGVMGFNDDATTSTNVYAKVVNLGTTSTAVTVTLRIVQLEI